MRPQPSRRTAGGPTLSDVAHVAGVSPMTVSRVINGEANVRTQTRERVHAAVAQLGYSPNRAASLLAGGAQCRIGLVYGNPSSAYLSEVLVGCLAEAASAHVQLQLEKFDGEEGSDEAMARLAASGINGVILPPPYSDDQRLIAALTQAGLTVAILASSDPAPGITAMSIDDARGAREMTRHLLQLGHERIGFVRGNPDQTASARRLSGYLEALAQAGLTVDDALVIQGDFTYRSGLAAAERLLALPDRPTAIFASNDDMAAAVVATAHRRHLDIPTDLSVCGFDDTALATTISPELTTVRQPIAEMAAAAVRTLFQAHRARRPLGEERHAAHRLFAHEIVVRESSGSRAAAKT